MKLDSNSVIGVGDSVKTLDDGRLELRISDDIYRIGANTLIAIPESDTGQSGEGKTVNLISGEMWSVFELSSGLRQSLFLPKAEVLGTDFVARFSVGDDGTSEIKVYSGKIEISRRLIPVIDSIETDDGDDSTNITEHTPESWSVTLDTGEKLIISSRGEIIYRSSFGPDDPDENIEWVRWNKDRSGN